MHEKREGIASLLSGRGTRNKFRNKYKEAAVKLSISVRIGYGRVL